MCSPPLRSECMWLLNCHQSRLFSVRCHVFGHPHNPSAGLAPSQWIGDKQNIYFYLMHTWCLKKEKQTIIILQQSNKTLKHKNRKLRGCNDFLWSWENEHRILAFTKTKNTLLVSETQCDQMQPWAPCKPAPTRTCNLRDKYHRPHSWTTSQVHEIRGCVSSSLLEPQHLEWGFRTECMLYTESWKKCMNR